MKSCYYIFTDGSSYNNGCKDKKEPQISASGYAIVHTDNIYGTDVILREGYTICENTNINYGELNAVYFSLISFDQYLKSNNIHSAVNIHLIGDNQYIIKGLNEWMYKWMKQPDGIWRNSKGVEITYSDKRIFEAIYNDFILNKRYNIKFWHINGHLLERENVKNASKESSKFEKTNNVKFSKDNISLFNQFIHYNNHVDFNVRNTLNRYICNRNNKPYINI